MNKTVIIIPSRLNAERLPNKQLELINNKEMILHVYEAAKKINSEVYVATPDQKIIDLVNLNKGKAVITSIDNQTSGKASKIETIALTAFDGGKMKQISDKSVYIPTMLKEYGPAEDLHMILDHLVSSYLMRYIRLLDANK